MGKPVIFTEFLEALASDIYAVLIPTFVTRTTL